jgi:GNAT superfamily N-acetyltransferase
MPLPILQTHHVPTPEGLVRLFHRAQLHWSRHLGEEALLDAGAAVVSAELRNVYEANRVLDAALPDANASPGDVVAQVEAHFAGEGSRCGAWVLNPSAAAEAVEPLACHLASRGYRRNEIDILLLGGSPAGVVREVPALTIIPARASFRHYRALAEESAAECGRADPAQWAEAGVTHLDDPHLDALVALKDGQPVASVAVLAVGEAGVIADLFVSPRLRRLGIGRTMMSRALEICARSLFKHVMIGAPPDDAPLNALCQPIGFRPLAKFVQFVRPD